jgi:hypothetical protein
MPSSVADLFESVGLSLGGSVQWKATVPKCGSGVYMVSLSDDPNMSNGLVPLAPIEQSAIEGWLARVPGLQIDGVKCASADELRKRLAGFWLSDENIVCIGKATSLRGRVGDYYRTPLGDPRPHAGGHWVKTLAILGGMRVYFAETPNPEEAEQGLLDAFIRGTSEAIRKYLFDPSLPVPFANLEFPRGTRKRHGITGSKVPRWSPLR